MVELLTLIWIFLGGYFINKIFLEHLENNKEALLPKGDQMPNYDHWGGPQGSVEGKTLGYTVPDNLKKC